MTELVTTGLTTTEPGNTEPGNTEPGNTEPGTTEPGTTRLTATELARTRPATEGLATMRPAAATAAHPVLLDIEQADFHGLCALADLAAGASGKRADLAGTAQALLHEAVQSKLDEAGLKWDPAPESVARRVSEAARPRSAMLRLLTGAGVRRYGGSALLVVVLVLLWGGYVKGWQWTGFQQNEQLWEWMHLLLLPLVVGTVPMWLRHSEYLSKARQRLLAGTAAAFAAFVAAGYLVPLKWTGFPGNTLWNWLGLLLLPTAVASAKFLPRMLRSLRRQQRLVIAALAAVWGLTIVGGYVWNWTWTGYQGNTLWDWLQLLLLPLLVPTVFMTAALNWIADNAPGTTETPKVTRRAAEAHTAAT